MSTTKDKKLLIVDDESDITFTIKGILEYNGFKVDAYTNPIEALNNFRQQRHNLIILDLKMQKMDGITLYQMIKEIDDKVIICLTTADKNFIQHLWKGIIDIEKIVMFKPFLLRNLKNKIDSFLVS